MTQNDPTAPFDESAALAELERLQTAIQAARRQRMQVNDEFNAFVRTIKAHPESEVPSAPRSVRTTDRAPRPSTPVRALPDAPPAPIPAPAMAAQPDATPYLEQAFPVSEAAPSTLAVPPVVPYAPASQSTTGLVGARPNRARPLMLGGALAVVALIGVFFWRSQDATPPAQSAPQQTSDPAPAGPPAAAPSPAPSAAAPTPSAQTPSPAGAPQPAAAAVPPFPNPAAPLQVELTTTRPSWMRIIVDGQRVIEREVKGGERLRYSANTAVAVRAGDAGAVHVSVAGAAPAIMGRDGQIANRTFTPPPGR